MALKNPQLGVEDVIDLDSQIIALQQQLAQLQETRNKKTSLLCRIPEELLVLVLSHLQTALLQEHCLDDWTATLCVCRRIRNVGLHWSKLWSTIQSSSHTHSNRTPNWMEFHHERRKGHPLTVHIIIDPHSRLPSPENLDNTILAYASSIRELFLSTASHWPLQSLLPLPQLQVLNIDIFDREECLSALRECLMHSSQLTSIDLRFKSTSTGLWNPITDDYGEIVTMVSLPGLRRVALQGKPRSIANALRILPDPLEELSVNLGNVVCDMKTECIKYILRRASGHVLSTGTPVSDHKMTFLVKSGEARFELYPISTVFGRTLHVTGTCSNAKDIPELSSLTSTAEFIDYAMPVAPSLTVSTSRTSSTWGLQFHPMGFNWPAAVLTFQQYLKSRKSLESPVGVLKIHTRSDLEYSIFKDQWMATQKEGLGGIVLERD